MQRVATHNSRNKPINDIYSMIFNCFDLVTISIYDELFLLLIFWLGLHVGVPKLEHIIVSEIGSF